MKNLIEWEARINENPSSLNLNVFIFQHLPNGTTDILQPDGQTVKNFTRGEDTKPTMIMSRTFLQLLFNELSHLGMKTPDKHFLEGKVESMGKHLEDMRRLVFEDKIEICSQEEILEKVGIK